MAKDELLGELKEFKRSTIEKLTNIENKVEELHKYKWRMSGVVITMVFFFEFAVSIYRMK